MQAANQCYALMIVTVAAFVGGSVSAAELDRASQLQKFDHIWTKLRDDFYDPAMSGLNWDDVGNRYRQRAVEAETRQAFQRVVNEMLAELKASHLAYYTVDDFDYYFFRQVFMPDQPGLDVEHIGMMGTVREDGYHVQAVFEEGPAASAGIKVGDRLLTIGRQPVTSAGTFRGFTGQAVALIVLRDGRETRVEVTPVRETAVAAFANATAASARIIEKDGKSIGYVHLWCCTHKEILQQLEYAVRVKLKETDGLVLDLRDGYGGYPAWFDYPFVQPAMELKIISRQGESVVEHFGYDHPLALLINAGSRSAKELFAYEMKKTGRARLIGANTAGYFLGAGAVMIGDDGLLMYPHSDLEIDGQKLEGIGVAPDIAVDAKGTYTAEDSQIATAVNDVVSRIVGPEKDRM